MYVDTDLLNEVCYLKYVNGAETNGGIAHNLGILLMNSLNCFAIFISSILVMSVQISIIKWL